MHFLAIFFLETVNAVTRMISFLIISKRILACLNGKWENGKCVCDAEYSGDACDSGKFYFSSTS